MDSLVQSDSAAGGFGTGTMPQLSLEEWQLAGSPAAVSVVVPGDADLEGQYEALVNAAEIIIELPVFMDGRAFSHARKLRDLGYTGKLLAGGDVLPDQWQFLERCGFSGLVDERNSEVATNLTRFSDAYQGYVGDDRPVFRRARGA